MNNDDTQRNPTKVERGEPSLAPSDAFARAIAEHQRATEAIGAAIRGTDPKAAEHAASAAFAYWLAARAIVRRLESAEDVNVPSVEIMRYVLRTNRTALVALFGRAEAGLAAPALHRVLAQLRSSLALADGERWPVRDARSNENKR